MMYTKIRDRIVKAYRQLLDQILTRIPVLPTNPDFVTFFGLALGILSGIIFTGGYFLLGGIVLLVSGITDTMDGEIARLSGTVTRRGALLDSTFDRYSDFAVLSGLLFFYRHDWLFVVILLAMIGSLMVSYTRARAEAVGSKKVVGVMQRPERVIILSGATILQGVLNIFTSIPPDIIVRIALITIALFSNITAIHRIISALKELEEPETKSYS